MSKATSTGALPLFTTPTTASSSNDGERVSRRTPKSVNVLHDLPDWRRLELAEKYAPRDAYEPDEVMDDE